MQTDKAIPVLATLEELKRALQDAHFAARELDLLLNARADARDADTVHALRIAAGELGRQIRAALAAQAVRA